MAGDSDSEREIGGLVSPNAAPAKGGAASPSLLMRRCADPIGSPRVSEGRERNTCLARLGVGRTMWAKEMSNDDTTRPDRARFRTGQHAGTHSLSRDRKSQRLNSS